ncbi:FkbM family methyltransferase [Methylorubrum extorquens]|uniref:FkbM family methyltransferase n=1 Tax=Methylorubrum extorquens TaxID=408 RepID=A0A1S1P0W4_METEX|nr:FkbM family methyltransferase [Methylorubrum extorquens]
MSNYTRHERDGRVDHYSFSFAGREIKLTEHPGTILSVESLAAGIYETPLPILLMAAVARTEGSLCDVGGNIGIYSVLAAKTKGNAHVYAFEPLPEARSVLIENLRLNGVSHQVELNECALSDTEGTAALHLPDPGHGLLETSASLEADFKTAANTIEVPIRTLDSLKLSRKLAIVKADIEGHEAAFLRGATNTLAEDRPIVFAEVLSGAYKTLFNLSKMMEGLQYIPFRMRPDVVIHTKIIVPDKGWNYAFIPAEKIDLFRDCCRAHDIEMLRSY